VWDGELPGIGDVSEMSPQEVRDAWDDLSYSERRDLIATYPEPIGSTDGIPADDRIEANRIVMARHVQQLEALADALEEEGPFWVQDEVEEMRERAEMIQGWLDDDRDFILFDPRGDGRVAEVFGDIEDAEHLAISVPGMNNDIGNFENTSNNALALFQSLEQFAPAGEDVAAIAWLGYDTPEGLSAAFQGAAEDGAENLDPFVDALHLDSDAGITVVSHSYGTVVAGLALKDEGLDVSDVIFVGSPGPGALHRSEFPDDVGVWGGKARGDVVAVLNWHGTDPASALFGGDRFETGDISGHSQYFKPHSLSLRNMTFIVLGMDDEVSRP
jgi:pimeloyl-ACP methyl ester carboxylesterase